MNEEYDYWTFVVLQPRPLAIAGRPDEAEVQMFIMKVEHGTNPEVSVIEAGWFGSVKYCRPATSMEIGIVEEGHRSQTADRTN